MTKRIRRGCLVLAAILAALFEVLTLEIMENNRFLLILSAFLYFANSVCVVANIYYAVTTKFVKYHAYVTLGDISLLGFQLAVYYTLGNLPIKEIQHSIVAIIIAGVLMCMRVTFSRLAETICPYVCSE